MKIKILGTRGEIDTSGPYHARHSGILIDGTLLFDLGEKEFLTYNPTHIFITHLHPDHAYFVRSGQKFPRIKAPLYAPESYTSKIKSRGHKKEREKIVGVKKFVSPFIWQGYTITAIPTEHSLKVKSHAYLIEKNKTRILYTGDLFWIKKKYQKLLGKLDLVITEGSYLKEGGMIRRSKQTKTMANQDTGTLGPSGEPFGHTGIPNLMRLFAPHTKKIVLGHFGTWFYTLGARKAHAELKRLGKKYGVTVITGYDNMPLTI